MLRTHLGVGVTEGRPGPKYNILGALTSKKADLPPQWNFVRNLIEGGQGYTFVVRRSGGSDPNLYVLKCLKNLKRTDYFRTGNPSVHNFRSPERSESAGPRTHAPRKTLLGYGVLHRRVPGKAPSV